MLFIRKPIVREVIYVTTDTDGFAECFWNLVHPAIKHLLSCIDVLSHVDG